MAVTVERLIATLEARFDKYDRDLNRALGQTNRTFARIETRGKQMESRMAAISSRVGSSFIGIGRGFAASLAAGFSARAMQQLMDSATRISNALKVTGLEGAELERVYGRLRDSAMRNYAPLETLATLYSRLGLAQKSLGVSVDEMLNFTDKVALALRVQGSTAQEARGALIQLSQAMGAGIVRAEEFNSIVEGAPTILRAAAAGLKEAGGEVSKLRQLVIDGKLSSQAFFRAFEAGAPLLEKMVSNADVTFSQAFENMQTALVDSVKEFDAATDASKRFAGGINNAARAISDFDVGGFVAKISKAGGALEQFLNDLGNAGIIQRLNESLGTMDSDGFVFNFRTDAAKAEAATLAREVELLQATIQRNTNLGVDNTEALARLNEVSARLETLRNQISNLPTYEDVPGFRQAEGPPTRRGRRRLVAAEPVSIKDFAVPAKEKKGAKERADEYERLTKSIADSTAALVAETEVLRQADPTINDYGYALEKARAEHDLLTAAQEAGKKVTPELRAEIAALAEQYALATVEAAKLGESQDEIRRRAEEMRDFQKELTRGIVDGFIEGKKAADIFADALQRIGNKLLDMAFDSAFSSNSGGGGGWLGSLLGGIGSLFSRRENGGPVRKGQPYIVGERRPELFVPDQNGTILKNVPTVSAATTKSSGSISAPVTVNIDARNADREGLARVEQQVARLKAELPARVIEGVRHAQKSNVKFG